METPPVPFYLPVLFFLLVISTAVAAQWAESRRGNRPDWSNIFGVIVGLTLGMLLMSLVVATLHVLPAIGVVYIIAKLSYPSGAYVDSLTQVEAVGKLAAFISISANFADVASTFDRPTLSRHMRQWWVTVPLLYYTTLIASWCLAFLSFTRTGETVAALQPWQLFRLPMFTPNRGLNILLVVIIVISVALVSFLLRRRGEERPRSEALRSA